MGDVQCGMPEVAAEGNNDSTTDQERSVRDLPT